MTRHLDLLALPDTTAPVDVVIDTDVLNEVDDQFAIVWALLRPDRLRVRGLLACPWASSPELYARADVDPMADRTSKDLTDRRVQKIGPEQGVALSVGELHKIADLVGVDVPVWSGSPSWMVDEQTPVRSEGVDALVAMAHEQREGPLYVVAIGAATNLASAVLQDPSIRERICVVWTSAYPTWWPRPNASYNLTGDLHASRVLLDSGVPLVYVPGFYVGEELRVGRLELEAHVRGKGPLGDYLWSTFADHWMSGSERPGFSKVIWDLVCVAWLLDPTLLPTDLQPTPVLGSDLRWEHPEGRPQLREAWDVDRDRVFGDLYRVLGERA